MEPPVFSFGIGELLTIGFLGLVLFKPEEIPKVARELGRLYAKLRRMANELQRSLTLEADRMDEEERLRTLAERRRKAEAARKAMADAAGSKAQPDVVPPAAPPDAEAIPPGFSAEEWDDMPPHVRAMMKRRHASGPAGAPDDADDEPDEASDDGARGQDPSGEAA